MAGEATVRLSERDYVDANRELLRGTLIAWRKLPDHGVTIAVCASVGVFVSLSEGSDPTANMLLFALLGMAGMILFYGVCYLTVPGRTRRLFQQQAGLQVPIHYAWSDAGFGYSSEHASANFAWRDYYRWSEGRHGFMVFLNEQIFYLVPRHALTDAQARDLRSTAEAHGPPRF